MSAASFRQKVDELQEQINKASASVSTGKCVPILLIVGIAVPFVIALLLYLLQPWFAQRKEGTKKIRSGTKIFWYTVLFTLIIWAGMAFWGWCRGWYNLPMLCSTA